MALIYREWRILAASALAILMIAGAFILAEQGGRTPVAEASTESALLAQIASRDTTGDGLPDWEKPLYGIPLNATTTDYFHLGMTDGEAVAKGLIVPKATADLPADTSAPEPAVDSPAGSPDGTLTNAFAENFLTLYLNAKEQNNGTDLTQDQVSALASQALSELDDSISPAPHFKSAADLTVSGSGAAALTSYANDAAQVFAVNSPNLPQSELLYLQDAANGDPSAITDMQKIAAAYQNIAVGLAALPVPQEAASADLALVNATARLSAVTSDFARVDTDPVATMLAIQQYPAAVTGLASALQSISTAYQEAGVVLDTRTTGGSFVNMLQYIGSSTPQSP